MKFYTEVLLFETLLYDVPFLGQFPRENFRQGVFIGR